MLAAPPEQLTCMIFPSKALYETADAASVALREIAVSYMERGIFDPRLVAYACRDHYHLGRIKEQRAS